MRPARQLVDAALRRADHVAAGVARIPDLAEHEAHRSAESWQTQRSSSRRHRQERDPVETRPAGPAVDVPLPPGVWCAPMLAARTTPPGWRAASAPTRPGANSEGRAPPRRAISWTAEGLVAVADRLGEPDQRAQAVRDAAEALPRVSVLRMQPRVARRQAVAGDELEAQVQRPAGGHHAPGAFPR